jgi:arginase
MARTDFSSGERVSAKLGVIGVPTSAGAFAPGQEQAPQALRDAGLVDALRGSGIEVCDHGDRELWRWRPDRQNRRAQNLDMVVEIVQETARRVRDSIAENEVTLVLGGDCTVGIGTVAGHVTTGERVGLIYFDAHADLNVPHSVREGALDWMGLAHMSGEPGASPQLIAVGKTAPLLETDQVLLFGWDHEQATAFERDVIERRRIKVVPVADVAADPEGAAVCARRWMEHRCDRLLVHFDVDVIDFTDVPLSENSGRNRGLSFDHALRALNALLSSPLLAGLTITELNPDHTEPGAGALERFAKAVAQSLTGALRTPGNTR